MNIEREHDERKSDHGFRFYGVVTLGNLLVVVGSIVPILIWGIRLEGRVDHEADLRSRLESRVSEQVVTNERSGQRIESLLNRMNEDITAVRVRLGVMRDGEPPAVLRGQQPAR